MKIYAEACFGSQLPFHLSTAWLCILKLVKVKNISQETQSYIPNSIFSCNVNILINKKIIKVFS